MKIFLAQQNYNLILTARGRQTLQSTADEITSSGEIIALAGNVADAAHRRRLVAAAHEFGGLNLLVNNASTLGPTPLPELSQYQTEALHYLFDVNVIAPIGLIQEALPLLQSSGGLIVNLSSDAAVGGYPGWGGYGASKAALDLISLTLANELPPPKWGWSPLTPAIYAPTCTRLPSPEKISPTAPSQKSPSPSGAGYWGKTRFP
ncbi:MAG: SDR family oxidoreductase [Anaerolineae bacterium]|nr:SDR family oxidoreductase [Anaerolineae bacterium]